MSEEQLTVAELLARSGTSPSGSGSRRRRRRSLEEGGISVAELTGSIPRVTEKPEDARHTTSPIDSTVEKDEKSEVKQAKQAEKKADAGTKSAAEQQPKAEKAEATKDKKASDDSQVKKPAESTKAKKFSEPQTASEEKTSEKAEAARESRDDDTMVLRVFTDGESAPLTTGSFPAVPAQGKQGEQAFPATTAPKSEDTEQSSDKADATSVLPKVVVDDEDEPEYTAAKVQQADTSQDIPQDATEEDNFFPEEDEDADDLVDDAEEEYDEDEKPSIAGIVVTAVVAFIIGVLVFYAFMSLWASSVMPLIVIIAALVVTVAIGVAVHSLKTGKDTLTTVLATVTGLVLTFGPALVTGL